MDVPAGFAAFEPQGPFLEHIGPVHARDDADGRVFGLRAEARHTNHRGTIQGGLLSTFADFALGRAIEADAEDGKDRATVSQAGGAQQVAVLPAEALGDPRVEACDRGAAASTSAGTASSASGLPWMS